MLTVGSLFTGVYGIELGLERTGYFKTIWMVENDEFCRKVLRKHHPKIPLYGDIREIDWATMPRVDMLTGGFPCQDISCTNPKGRGIEGSRSGLWREYAKAIGVLRPKYALVENVPAIVRKGLDVVLADLAEAGYDAEWFDLRASDFGALHKRERIFIVAFDPNQRKPSEVGEIPQGEASAVGRTSKDAIAHNHGNGFAGEGLPILTGRPRQDNPRDKDGAAPDSPRNRCGKNAIKIPLPPVEVWGEVQQGRQAEPIITYNYCNKLSKFIAKKNQSKEGFSWCQNIRKVEDLQGRPDIPEPLFRGARDGISSRLYLSVIGKGKEHDTESITEIDRIRREILFDMWHNGESSETPPRIQSRDVCNCLSEMPQGYSHEAGYLGERIEEDEILRCLWQDIRSSPFEETHDLQSRMLERIREKERLQATENSQWVNRIKALGNAVVPDCAEFIGEMIMEFDLKRRAGGRDFFTDLGDHLYAGANP